MISCPYQRSRPRTVLRTSRTDFTLALEGERLHPVLVLLVEEGREVQSAPPAMATLRNLVIALIRIYEKTREKARNIPVVLRELTHCPDRVLALLGV